jgi:hypothetical protein
MTPKVLWGSSRKRLRLPELISWYPTTCGARVRASVILAGGELDQIQFLPFGVLIAA